MAKSPRRRMAKKDLYRHFLPRRDGPAGGLCAKVDWPAVWKVIRHDRTAPDRRGGADDSELPDLWLHDLLGRAWCGHKLAKRQVMLVSFICYAFNLTLSYRVGGGRYALPPLFASRFERRDHYAHFLLEHHHQLAGLYSAGRRDFQCQSGGVTGALVISAGHAAAHRGRTAGDVRSLSVGLRLRPSAPSDD